MRGRRGGWFCRVTFSRTSRTLLGIVFPRSALPCRGRLLRFCSIALVRRRGWMVARLRPARRCRAIPRGPVFRWTLLRGTSLSTPVSGRSRGPRFFRRHRRSMVSPASGLGSYYAFSAEFTGPGRSRDRRSSMVGRCKQGTILTCGMFLLHLRRHRRSVRLMGVAFLFRRWPCGNSALSAVKRHVRFVVHDHRAIHVNVGDVW